MKIQFVSRAYYFFLVLTLVACGGGAGGGDDNAPPVGSNPVPATEVGNGVVPVPAPAPAPTPEPTTGLEDEGPANGDSVADEPVQMIVETAFDPHWGDTGVFSSGAGCSECHRASSDGSVMRLPPSAEGVDISPASGWGHSMMAHAWNDPYFQALVEDQAKEFADYAGDIEDKCLSCHAPMAHTTAHALNQDLTSNDCSIGGECYRIETASRQAHAREGVSCTLCHQMVAGEAEPGSGNYTVANAGEPGALTIFGPYPEPLTRPMLNNTRYRVRYSDYISSSEHCGSCHELETPSFDVNTGHPQQPVKLFREQATYSEWRNSSYTGVGNDGRSCQDCHMPQPENYSTPIAVTRSGSVHPNWPTRAPFSRHDPAGGNTYVLGLMQTWREELGIANSTTVEGFQKAIDATRDMLGRAATVSFTRAVMGRQQLDLDVQIVNHTGHKLPSAFPSRRMWLQLTVHDAAGEVLFDSGAPDERGYLTVDGRDLAPHCLALAKPAGFDNANCFEPHRQIITRPGQVAIYEAVMADSNRHIVYSLLYGAGYLKDNRIPPAGFSSTSPEYDPATASVGVAEDGDFNLLLGEEGSGSDTVHYRIALPAEAGPVSVHAKLWYQSIRPAFVAALAHPGGKSDRMRRMYREQPPLPELLDEQALALRP